MKNFIAFTFQRSYGSETVRQLAKMVDVYPINEPFMIKETMEHFLKTTFNLDSDHYCFRNYDEILAQYQKNYPKVAFKILINNKNQNLVEKLNFSGFRFDIVRTDILNQFMSYAHHKYHTQYQGWSIPASQINKTIPMDKLQEMMYGEFRKNFTSYILYLTTSKLPKILIDAETSSIKTVKKLWTFLGLQYQ